MLKKNHKSASFSLDLIARFALFCSQATGNGPDAILPTETEDGINMERLFKHCN